MTAALPDIAERMQKAILKESGIRFERDEYNLLVAIGFFDLVQTENAKMLRQQCQTRAMKTNSIAGGDTASSGIEGPMEPSVRPIPRSNGTTQPADASGLNRRAQRISGRPRSN